MRTDLEEETFYSGTDYCLVLKSSGNTCENPRKAQTSIVYISTLDSLLLVKALQDWEAEGGRGRPRE